MGQLKIPSKYPDSTQLRDLELNTVLTIRKAESGKTEKKGYTCVTLYTDERGPIFATEAGVIRQLAQLGAGKTELGKDVLGKDVSNEKLFEYLEKGCALITDDNFLKVAISSYKNSFDGMRAYTIRNVA